MGHCLTLEDINATVADITQAYVDKGLVTSRAYLPTQDLADGTLEILVVEGKVDAIKLVIGGKPRWGLDTAFPWLEGDVLNLRDIEQGLDQINRLSTIDAKVHQQVAPAVAGSIEVDGNPVATSSAALIAAPNGVPVVNIAAPNGNGLSHNRFRNFNVDGRGVILNNSPIDAKSKLGGVILGNGKLQGRSASTILSVGGPGCGSAGQ